MLEDLVEMKPVENFSLLSMPMFLWVLTGWIHLTKCSAK